MSKTSEFGKWNGIILSAFFVAFVGVKLWQLRIPVAVVRISDERLTVMVAKNLYHQRKGLGGRETILPYDGMLFIFSPASRVPIVMRDMQFPIDIVWFSGNRVIDIAKNVPVEPQAKEDTFLRYIPRKPANLVLELPAGWADAHQLKIGDTMVLLSE